jgi:hypothetical protein
MTIDELEDKSLDLVADIKNEEGHYDNIIELSIEFAISVLEELHSKNVSYFYFVDAKIQELKTYLENGN